MKLVYDSSDLVHRVAIPTFIHLKVETVRHGLNSMTAESFTPDTATCVADHTVIHLMIGAVCRSLDVVTGVSDTLILQTE
jgi:hypothetical protein